MKRLSIILLLFVLSVPDLTSKTKEWANDIVKDNVMVYRWNLPETKILREDTVEISKNLVNLQMRNAGYRLAYLLNKYFGK